MYYDREDVIKNHGLDVADAVGELFTLFHDGMYKWLAGLYDHEIGGFYYANSSRDNDGFLPDIESTGQALGCLAQLGIAYTATLPEPMKSKIRDFTLSLQDPDDGYFYHPQWGKEVNSSRRGRDLDFSLGTLRALGVKPLYPTAIERITDKDAKKDTVPEYLKSEEAFVKWLTDLDICTYSYPKGHTISSICTQIKAAGLADVCVDFVSKLQRPDTGLWEDNLDYQTANGLLKISTIYPAFGRKFPNATNAVRTEIKVVFMEEPVGGIVDIYNPWVALDILRRNIEQFGTAEELCEVKELLRENAAAMLRKTKEKLQVFYKPDGSFSYCPDKSAPYSQGAHASMGLNEGDVNATALANATRRLPLKVLDISDPIPFGEEDSKIFFEIIESRRAK